MLNIFKKLFMGRRRTVVDNEITDATTEQNPKVSTGPKGFNETTGEKITKDGFIAYMKNMEENEPEKFAKKKDELEKKLSEFGE